MLKLLFISFVFIGTVKSKDVSYYEILGVSKQASGQEIRQAYKKLAVKLHPDKNSNETEQDKFLKITEAYETLKDPEKRRKYDMYGSYPSYTRKYDYHSQAEYNNLYYNGLYHGDPYVDTLSGAGFYSYLNEGFLFVNFYSPFCPPCQNLVDHWKKLAEVYKGIVKVGAVNCKYHNSFCYNSMRIGSYPSLLFYPNGRNGNYIYYRGEHSFDALEQFVVSHLKNKVHVPTVTQLRGDDKPMAYVLGSNKIEMNKLLRIAYQLKGLVTVVIVEDDTIRSMLTKDEYTTVIFKYRGASREIKSTDEKDIVKKIVNALPTTEAINPDKLKNIRNQLRNGYKNTWVLYFTSEGENRLLLHQMRIAFPDMHFGEINCDKWRQLCASLQVAETPAWALLKRGGAYQRATHRDIRAFIDDSARATKLHTLSASELVRILDGDVGAWVLVVVPYQVSWNHLVDPFTRASLHFTDSDDINFGIMVCTLNTDKYCRQVAHSKPAIIVQNATRRNTYSGDADEQHLVEFVELLRNSAGLELTEHQVLEVLDPSSREQSWLVAYLPSACGARCEQLLHEWRLVARKLQPLSFVRVGVLKCTHDAGFCNNIRSPTARLYPIASGQHYTVSLEQLSEAPYMLEWAFQYIDDSVQKFNWQTFSKTVIAEELRPTSGKKPWLVYFHSPRCYRCYEMFADFALAGILLNDAVQLGKVNCVSDRGVCQHELITSYPSLKLYLPRNQRQQFSSVISIQVRDYTSVISDVRRHLLSYYDENLPDLGVKHGVHMKHDEF